MTAPTVETTAPDESVETAGRGGVATLFFTFGLFGGFVLVLGFVLSLVEGSLATQHPWPSPGAIARDLLARRSEGLIGLGLALLLLLPVVRNLSIAYVLIRRRQRRATLLTLLGLLAMVALYVLLQIRSGA